MPRITEPRPGEPITLSFTKTGAPTYRARVDIAPPGSPRKQLSRNFPTLKAARDFVAQTRADLSRGTHTSPGKTTVEQLLDRWIAVCEADPSLRKVTTDAYAAWLLPARRYFNGRPVASIKYSDVEQFRGWCLKQGGRDGKPMSARSVTGTLGVLRRALQMAVRDGVLPANPATGVKRPPQRKTSNHWTPQQLATFREYADRDELAGPLRLILCGLRRSEALGLEWEDLTPLPVAVATIRQGRVALADGRTEVGPPKSSASARTIPVEALWPGTVHLLGERGTGLIVRDAVGQPLRPEVLSDRFRRIAAKAKLPAIKMHEVRHSLATILASDPTVPDVDAASLLGHDVTTFHQVYTQRTSEGAARAASAAGAALHRPTQR